jgi:hypothetical protein
MSKGKKSQKSGASLLQNGSAELRRDFGAGVDAWVLQSATDYDRLPDAA